MAKAALAAKDQSQSIHPVDQMLPLSQLLIYGLQHVLAMYAGAVAVPLIVGSALKLSQEQIIYLINADLFTCGIATLIQTLGLGKIPIGIKLPVIQGCTFAAVTPMILIGGAHGLTAIYGSIIIAGLFTLLISPFFSRLIAFFPPVVTGSVITIIGISLLPVAVTWAGGGNPTASNFGNSEFIILAFVILLLILLIYRFFKGFISNIAILLGLVIGLLIAIPLGLTNFSAVASSAWLGVTTPFRYGLPTFDIASTISMMLVMLVSMMETTGDFIAVGEIVGRPLTRSALTRGLQADGLSTIIGGILNSFPYTAFAQNVGLVSLTGVKSRFVVSSAGVILMALGLFPKLAAIVASIPAPVLGGAGIALFGAVAANGIKVLSKVDFKDNNNLLIVAISVGVGLIPVGAPGIYHEFPGWLQIILNSGITAGSITAILLNLFFMALRKPQPAAAESAKAETEVEQAETLYQPGLDVE
ncbi:MAG: purine permease [Ktedonobacteraceae bacterium]|nr:purine permease [Ktedonobacteraceae bacterium]